MEDCETAANGIGNGGPFDIGHAAGHGVGPLRGLPHRLSNGQVGARSPQC